MILNKKVEINKSMIRQAQQCLADNGIDKEETATVLQALGYILLDTELEDMLDWEFERKEYKNNIETEKEIIKALLLYKKDLNSLCSRLQADYNCDKEFEQMEEDRLGLCYIMELVEELK